MWLMLSILIWIFFLKITHARVSIHYLEFLWLILYIPFVKGVLQAKYPFIFIFLISKNWLQNIFKVSIPQGLIYSPFVAAMPDENNMLILGNFCRFWCGFKSHLLQIKKKTVLSQFIAYLIEEADLTSSFLFFRYQQLYAGDI